MKLRLYHHQDGARVAYRESGTGRAIVLLHSLGLTHREWEPVTEALSARFRVVAPDLPLHGDSEDRPRHPYSPDWLVDVIAGFCREAGVQPPAPACRIRRSMLSSASKSTMSAWRYSTPDPVSNSASSST